MEAKVLAMRMLHRPLEEADSCQPFLPEAMFRGRPHWLLTPWLSVCFDHSVWVSRHLSHDAI